MCHMAPAVMNRRDGQVVDERVTVLLVVQQLNNTGLACKTVTRTVPFRLDTKGWQQRCMVQRR